MNETAKTRRLFTPDELALLRGPGIDIGCGSEPIMPDAVAFDVAQGDANEITRFVTDTFAYVYSSHCLEHMRDPRRALAEWWTLVRPGGHLVLIVPDEDLYEQGYWPPRFNRDHKWTFTLAKQCSWSPVSLNVFALVQALPGAIVQTIRLQDNAYRRELLCHGPGSVTVSDRLRRWLHRRGASLLRRRPTGDEPVTVAHRAGKPVDQTQYRDVVAQILCIVRKDGK